MKRNIIIVLISILFSYNSFSQIGNEIVSYVDSTEVLVHNGRKMILKELGDSNLIRTKEIYDYLTEATKNNHYSAFFYLEDMYINMLAGDWQLVNTLMLDYEKYRNKVIYPNSQELIQKIFLMILGNSEGILSNSRSSAMDDQAKQLIEILLFYIETESPGQEYNEKWKAYKNEYDNPRYASFEKDFMPNKIIKASWSISMGSGMIVTTGDLSSNFSNNASFNMGMDINIHKVFTSMYLHATNLRLQKPFRVVSDSNTLDFKLNEKFTYLDAGLKAGYFLIRSNRFHLTPYASISGSFLESMRYDSPEDNNLEYEIFNSFAYGAGLHTEFKVLDFVNPNVYYGGSSNGYFSIKLETGYNKIAKFKDTTAIGDTPYFMLALVMGFGDF